MLQTQRDGAVTAGTQSDWMCLKSEKIPSARVGHTCTYVPSNEPNDNGRIYLIGGASHDGVCSDVHVLDLTSLVWTPQLSTGFVARYEHTAFYTASHPTKIFVFAGANESGNSVPLQIFEINEQKWYTAKTEGPSPPIRTFHNGATSSDWLVVFGGGNLGTNPVQDDKVYMFNAAHSKWKILETKGLAPELRLGHAMLIIKDLLYLHGGMVGTSLFDDLFTLNLDSGVWSNPTTNGNVPSARAGHVMFSNHDSESIYIFGGMTMNGASNELFKLNIGKDNKNNGMVGD
ncbi:hypothetical protein HELRODRAFT_166424 [Helobdella robusta]|uniref:Rab9 effector protein with kelch motifs n=1 Tax=Helobdella robusta TaxID=6412 RepID=T1EY44_HELRO|nr:hypothetical protein HELRODRAFT_166424 [Helobdella robusta]ESN90721.1 hypothetical protein HELRODRAFT_166424 [Helobdella robusta]